MTATFIAQSRLRSANSRRGGRFWTAVRGQRRGVGNVGAIAALQQQSFFTIFEKETNFERGNLPTTTARPVGAPEETGFATQYSTPVTTPILRPWGGPFYSDVPGVENSKKDHLYPKVISQRLTPPA
jgi:hypothetical protein